MNKKLACISNYFAGILMLIFGAVYLFKNSFMPYHSVAVGSDWAAVDAGMQTLILALMRVAAGGYFATGVAVLLMQYNFARSKQNWIPCLILSIGLIESFTSIYATMIVRLNSPGKPPTAVAILGVVLLVVGYFFNRKSLKDNA